MRYASIPSLSRRALSLLAAKPSVELALRRPTTRTLRAMCWFNYILLQQEELAAIIEVIERRGACRLLIFGLGNDSRFWARLNHEGRTAFVEHHEDWYRRVMADDPQLEAYLVAYGSRRDEWRALLADPELLNMTLPSQVGEALWDVILVDAPPGANDADPGRMKSIFAARTLAAPQADIFVHDCHREVEQVYTDRFLTPQNFQRQVHKLRHYRMP